MLLFKQKPFFISEFIDGSPISFTVAIESPVHCNSGTSLTMNFTSNSCVGDVCSIYSTDVCTSAKNTVTTFATNKLGHGMNYTTMIGEYHK